MEIVNNKIANIYPLTPLQYGMLFHNLYEQGSSEYVEQDVFKVKKEISSERLKEALQLLANKYSVLRTFFVYEKVKDACQVVLKERILDFDYMDLSNLHSEELENLVNKALSFEVKRGFNLQKDSLFRLKCIKLSSSENMIAFTYHHIIMDGWCSNILFNDLLNFYKRLINKEKYESILEEINSLNVKKNDYGDYIKWLAKQDKEKAKKYWKKELEGYDNYCDIKPTIKPAPTEEQMRKCTIELGINETKKLKAIAEKAGSTINIVAESAVGIMLQAYTGSKDVVFGKVVSGRNADIPGIEDMVGLFINTIPLRVTTEKEETTIVELLKEQQKKSIESTNYDYCSLAEIQNLTVQGSELIKILYVFENYNSGLKDNENNNSGITIESSREQTNYGLTIASFEYERKLCFKFMYDPNKYCEEEIQLIMDRLLKICEEIGNKPNAKVFEIETVTESEKSLILNDFNETETEYPRDKTVAELFEEQVKKTPDNIALVFEDKELTYAELNARANSLAHKLRELGVKPDDFVAIIADRSVEMICGIYGIIKAGGAYVPIDPIYPEDRIAFMLEDCQPKAVLKYTTESITIDNEIPVIDLSESKVWEGASDDLEIVNKPEDAIYCIYTSGTTGKPKGVINRNYGLINRILWMNSRYPIGTGDTILQKTTFTFDVSVWEIIWWSIVGARVSLLIPGGEKEPDTICDTIEKYEVTTMHFVPSMLSMFEEYVLETKGAAEKLKSLKNVFASGEALKKVHVDNFYKIAESAGLGMKLANFYGPTEASIDVTYYDCVIEDRNSVPIGKPIDNTQIYIINGSKLCGVGIPGELCIAGDGLARGYLNRPELTAEKFADNLFGEGKMYHSGDLARWLPDGNIEYLGRIDDQIKIRGQRLELGEIDAKIREIENIKDCAVIAKADSTGDKAIYAYYTSDEEVSVSEIRDRLSESLPEYMVPSYMMQIESIPVTRNGKLDRRALPEIESKTTREYVAPRNKAEEAVCNAFSEILGVERVGVQDSFFELGGDSIKAIRIISKLRNAGYTATVKDVMSGKTAERIALAVKNANERQKYEQGEVTGKVESTPIIKEFSKWNLAKPEHFNQSMMFPVDGIENNVIHKAIEELVKHHDVLRAVYRENTLEILPISESKICDFYEFDYSCEADKHKAVEDKCTEIQGSIDLVNGPLVKIAVFELGDTKQMMFCIHHLAVDGVSWRILQEDFETAVSQIKAGKEVKLPEKTASFIEWSQKLKEYGEKLGSKEKEYWKKANAKVSEGKIAEEYAESEIGYTTVEFSEETTEKLLTKSSNAYGAKIDEVLLAGLARAVGRITGQKSVAIKLEGHGREEIHEPISIDRTVGWFTNIYAISLECSEDNDEAIINAKDTIRSVPNMGMGYGYVEHSVEPDICFNYLGDFSGSKTSFASEYVTGKDIADENSLEDKITVNGQVANGKLEFFIMSQYGKELADSLKAEFENSVEALAEYCEKQRLKKIVDFNDLKNTDVKVYSESIFFDYVIDNEKCEYNPEKIANEYVKSIFNNNIIFQYKPLKLQKDYLDSFYNLCEVKLSLVDITLDVVVNILSEMVKTQEVFRTSYDKKNDMMKIYEYSKPIFSVVKNLNNKKWKSSLYMTYKQLCMYEESLLSRIFINVIDDNKIDIYFIFDHSVSDLKSCSLISEIFKNILEGNSKEYIPRRLFHEMVDSKKRLINEGSNINNIKKISTPINSFYDSMSIGNYKYACVEIKKICLEEEIEKVNTNPLKWIMNKVISILPDRFCDQIKNQYPFALIHNGRTTLDYQTLGLFISYIVGIYTGDESIETIMKEITTYQIKDKDIPDILEVIEEDNELLKYWKDIPVVNIQNDRLDLKVENNSILLTTTYKYPSNISIIINDNQIYVMMPVMYEEIDDLKSKLFSFFRNEEKFEFEIIKGE